jgi:PAS domain S-box-containing protein
MCSKPTYKDLENEITLLRKEISKIKNCNVVFNEYFESNTAVMLQIGPSSKHILEVNNAALNFYGFSKKEFLTKTIYDINTLSNDEIDSLMKKAVKKRSNYFEFQHQIADGSVKDVEVYMSPVKIDGNIRSVVTVNDVSARKRAEKELIDTNNRFKTTVNAVDAVVYVADIESYELLFVNDQFIRHFGDGVGKKCYEVIQAEQLSLCPFCTNKYLLDEKGNVNEPYIWEFQNTKTGQWYQCRDQAVKWLDGRLVRLEIATDITGRKLMEEEIREREKQLEELNVTKDKFFSIVAHDLKSPINSVIGFTDLLYQKFDNYPIEKQKEFISYIRNGLHNTFKLLENLLLWSRSQKGTIDFSPTWVNLYLITTDTVELLMQAADNKNISIEYKIPENTSIFADENMLQTILRNLISNAIKFTNQGGHVFIESKIRVKDDGKTYMQIMVKDNGIGISEDKHETLFDISVETTTRGTDDEFGTGLGLILCKEFVTMHKGEIWFESRSCEGSEFYFTLPLD